MNPLKHILWFFSLEHRIEHDFFLAALAYYHTINKNIEAAIKYANYAASITVKHLGVYAPSLEEIDHAIIR